MADFRYGNRELAIKLGADVVGEPLTDEIPFNNGNTVQCTTTGVMFYFADLPGQGMSGSRFVPFGDPAQEGAGT